MNYRQTLRAVDSLPQPSGSLIDDNTTVPDLVDERQPFIITIRSARQRNRLQPGVDSPGGSLKHRPLVKAIPAEIGRDDGHVNVAVGTRRAGRPRSEENGTLDPHASLGQLPDVPADQSVNFCVNHE